MLIRPRRNRRTDSIRKLLEETTLLKKDLVMPLFVIEGESKKEEIPGMPGQYRFSLDEVLRVVSTWHHDGLLAVDLFAAIDRNKKDPLGQEALNPNGLIPRTIRKLKEEFPQLCVISDIALDPFTSHGHDGVVNEHGYVMNDETVDILCKMSLLHAECGVDMVAPSDMMDGRVGSIRRYLDKHGRIDTSILSYAAKYASSLYGPFRNALNSHLAFGDKKTYQMNPANAKEALLEATLDAEEGADILMVKPALYYLDIIQKLSESTSLPIAAYHVSGEYSMVMAAQKEGMIDAKRNFLEALICIKRAGANLIFSYATPMLLKELP